MGAYLREARSRKAGLVLDAFDRFEGDERKKQLEKLMPRTMTVAEWDEFVKHVDSTEFKVNIKKMQEKCAKYDTPHTMSRQGIARMEEALKKELNTTDAIDEVNLWKHGHRQRKGKIPHHGVVEAFEKIEKVQAEHGDDVGLSILAKAFGEDKTTRRAKGIGFGATHKKVAAQSHFKLLIKECQESCKELNDRLAQIEGRDSRCVCNGVSPCSKASNNEASTSRTVLDDVREPTHTTPTSQVQVPKKSQNCLLLSWYKEDEVVAEAEIVETDPGKEIHGNQIGFGAYSVCVKLAYVEDAHVFKATTEVRTIDDAVSGVITWPKDRITYL